MPKAENKPSPLALKAFRDLYGKKAQPKTKKLTGKILNEREKKAKIAFAVPEKKILESLNKTEQTASTRESNLSEEKKKSFESMKPGVRRFHGARFSLTWFPFSKVNTACSDRFGYLSTPAIRNASKLPFTATMKALLEELGNLMGDSGRDASPDSGIPAGYTYFGQFVDHDITLDVSSDIELNTDANQINNMRSPALDLDSVYGQGPALDSFLYNMPSSGPSSAIKFKLGTNTPTGPGGPGGHAGFSGMLQQTSFDLPRIIDGNTAVIGDPRNDENLIVSQFHHAMLKFHNKVVDMLVVGGHTGDIFSEAKKIVVQHYQYALVHDFLRRICGDTAVNAALRNIRVAIGSPFRMPVEFSVGAYRFGHSMIRDNYWVNFNFPGATMAQVFEFNRNPNLPVFSNWVVDFNAFFDTGIPVPINNKARKIDSVLSNELERIPGGSGIMAILAGRNLRRGLAFGLPSGQALAKSFRLPVLTEDQIKDGLPANEVSVLEKNNKILLKKTPLWYYILREARVTQDGEQLGPLGAKIVADTFVTMLKRDQNSILNVTGGFTPTLPSKTTGTFTVTDLIIFAGVNLPS